MVVLLLGSSCGSTSGSAVLYLVDTLRADHLHCYGYERETSPRIDAFAAESIRFENCLGQSTWTMPATASILTGQYPARHGATSEGGSIPASIPSIAERLQAQGWTTGAFVTNGWVSREDAGFRRGYDHFKSYRQLGQEMPYERAEVVVDDALAWIEEVADERFFALVHTMDPHHPYDPVPPFDTQFGGDYEGTVTGRYGKVKGEHYSKLDPEGWQRLRDLYDGEIAYSDREFGRFLDGLDELGRSETTAVFLVSDHGEEFNDHGGSHDGLALQIDILPTILDVLGCDPDPALPGKSLLDRLRLGPEDADVGISETDWWGVYRKAVVVGNTKYVRQWVPEEREFLFDLAADPGERENVLELSPGDADIHRRILEDFRASTNEGFSVMIQNGGDEMLGVELIVTSERSPLKRVTLFYDEGGSSPNGSDGPVETSLVEGLDRTVVRFETKRHDVDGVVLVPDDGEVLLRVTLQVDGVPVAVENVHLGLLGAAVTELPLELDVAQNTLEAPGFGGGEDLAGAPYRVRIWRNMAAASGRVELTREDREALQAIGYLED